MPDDYTAACARATTEQGLDPVLAALRAAGYDAVAEQTGGFVMVATVYLNAEHTRWVGITDEGAPDGRYVVCWFDNDACSDGVMLDDCSTLTQVVEYVAVCTETRTCPVCRAPLPRTVDPNTGALWFRCEGCDVQSCGDCGEWVTYVVRPRWEGWAHLEPGVECFLTPSAELAAAWARGETLGTVTR